MSRQSRARALALVTSVGVAFPALAQDGPTTFLTFQHDGLSEMFVDPRDMALRDALAMIPERIGELPGEIPDMPAEVAELIQVALRAAANPARIAVVYDGDDVSGGFYGYGFLASIECEDEDEAEEIGAAVSGVLTKIAEEQGAEIPLEPSERFEGMRELLLPLGLVSFGPRESEGGWRYELIVGNVHDADVPFAEPPRLIDADGFDPYASATLDFSALTPLSRMAINFSGESGPQVREVVTHLEEVGLVGEDAIRIEYEAGNSADASVQRWILRDARARAEALSLATEPLEAAELRAIPADALGAAIGRMSLDSVDAMIEEMAAKGVPVHQALADFKEQTGVDLIEDVAHALGGTAALYNSDSTGGGSLLSTVVLMAVRDHEKFSGAIAKLTDLANQKIDETGAHGRYVQLARWSLDEGADLLSLRFPGVPVPFEVTLALTEDWFIAALSPQAAAAAARQAMGEGDGGLAANPRFAEAFAEHGEGATSVSFIDTARTVRDGYGLLSLASSAVANLARSPGGAGQREPGMLLPVYGELVDERVRPTIKIARWQGDDMVTTTWGDRCLWVQAGGELGVASAAFPLLAAGVAAGAIAGQGHEFGAIDAAPFPQQAFETARRTLVIDPVADAASVFLAAASLQAGFDNADAWPDSAP